MCYYQPNPPTCMCPFAQLIQPCPNAHHFPPPDPMRNPNPLVRVCGTREFAKGVGFRVCGGCRVRGVYLGQGQGLGQGLITMGGGGQENIGMGMGMGMDYRYHTGSMGVGGARPGTHTETGRMAGQTPVPDASALQAIAMEGLIASSGLPTGIPIGVPTAATFPSASASASASAPAPETEMESPNDENRRLRTVLPAPSPVRRMAIPEALEIASGSVSEAGEHLHLPLTPANNSGMETIDEEARYQNQDQEQDQGVGRGHVLGELETIHEDRMESPSISAQGEDASIVVGPRGLESFGTGAGASSDIEDDTAEAPSEGVEKRNVDTDIDIDMDVGGESDSDAPLIDQIYAPKIDCENGYENEANAGGIDDHVERMVLTLV